MFLSALIDRIGDAGAPPEVISDVYVALFEEYPIVEETVYSQAMSTAQDDPWIPEETAMEILAAFNIPAPEVVL